MAATVAPSSSTDSSAAEVKPYVGWTVDHESQYLGDCDSFYYVVYFDPEKASFERYCTGYSPIGQPVDAPADVREAWALEQAARKARVLAFSAAQAIRQRVEEAAIEAATPSVGKTVRVVRGRKVPLGTEGVVKFYTESSYGYRPTWRVLLVTPDGTKHWTDAHNVEVIAQA